MYGGALNCAPFFLCAMKNDSTMEKIRDDYDYVGWVPCISGHLLFEYTSCGLADHESEIYSEVNHVENEADTQEYRRYIIVSSGVNWKDGESHLDGKFRVVLLASITLVADQLEGQVYIIPYKNNEWESRSIGEKLLEIKRLSVAGDDIKTSFAELKNELDNIPTNKIFTTNFKLIRSGFLLLRYNKKGDQVTSETAFVIARQTYYYVKNTFHKHAHHDKSAESLTTTYRLPEDNAAIGMVLSNDLKRSLVQLKRDFNASDYRLLLQAKGIISYAKSLLVSCEKEGFMTHKDFVAEKSYIENLSESLEVTAKKIESQLAAEEKISSNFRAMILFALTVIAPITIIFREEILRTIGINKPFYIVRGIGHVAQSDSNIFALVGGILLIYLVYRGTVLKFGSLGFAFVGLHRVIESVCFSKRRATVIITTLLGLAFLLFYAAWMNLS